MENIQNLDFGVYLKHLKQEQIFYNRCVPSIKYYARKRVTKITKGNWQENYKNVQKLEWGKKLFLYL